MKQLCKEDITVDRVWRGTYRKSNVFCLEFYLKELKIIFEKYEQEINRVDYDKLKVYNFESLKEIKRLNSYILKCIEYEDEKRKFFLDEIAKEQ